MASGVWIPIFQGCLLCQIQFENVSLSDAERDSSGETLQISSKDKLNTNGLSAHHQRLLMG